MLLRHIFESKRDKSVGIIFGRFNPPHMGHMKAWEMASENSSWYVGTNKSTQGPKDPLPFDIKVKAMEAVYPEIKGHIIAEQSWLTLASKIYKKHGNVVLNVYTDEAWVTKALVQYNGKEGAHGFYNFPNIQQQDTPRLSSATALRNAVAADNRDAFGQAAGVDPNTPIAGKPFFDVVKYYLMPHAEKAAAKTVKKKTKQPAGEPVSENSSISTMPTTEYVKGIYAAAAENGMGAPEIDAVKKQMVLAPNGEVDIIATMQKALQIFQSPAWKKMIADLTALVKKAEAQQSMMEGPSLPSTLKSITTNGEPITQLYGKLKAMAKRWVDNNGSLKGFHRNAAGQSAQWFNNFYFNKLQNDLYALTKQAPKYAPPLIAFLKDASEGREHRINFTEISGSLPPILFSIGKRIKDESLMQFARSWKARKDEYDSYLSQLESEVGSDDDFDYPGAKPEKSKVPGQQNAQAEQIVNNVLSKLPKNVAGEIRNAIARSPNKIQALHQELTKRKIQAIAEGVAETIPWKKAQTVLNHYGADYFGTSYDKLYFYKYRKQFTIGLIRDEDGNGNHSVSLSELNAMVRKLRGMRVPLSPFGEDVVEADQKPRCTKWTYSGQWPNQVATCVTWDSPAGGQAASPAKPTGSKVPGRPAVEEDNDPCWDSHKMVGTKKKGGEQVPNCVPKEHVNNLKKNLAELSSDMLGRYKKAASADASKSDKEGNFEKGNKRFKGIVKATNKQFDNDTKGKQ
jgi:hypothetical protein